MRDLWRTLHRNDDGITIESVLDLPASPGGAELCWGEAYPVLKAMDTNPTKKPAPVVEYSPRSQLRHPLTMLRDMARDLSISRELAWRLFVRNISSQYRQTLLGYLWVFLPPVVTTVTFVFLNSQDILRIKETSIPYPAYVMIGTLLWQGFADAVLSPLRIIAQSKSFLAKMHFPREALIMAGIGEVLFSFTIRLVLMFCVFIWYGMPLPDTAVLAPIGILSLIALGLMFGILLTPLGVLFQDIEKGLPLILGMWMLLTPVVYPQPTNWPASLLSKLNPVSPLLATTREMLTTGNLTQLHLFLIILGVTMLLLLLGWILYRLALPHLIERLNI
jgi:lipopolysaccharide transport system permease protein